MIREAIRDDYDKVWEIFSEVVKSGDTYAFDPQTPKEDFPRLWFADNMHTFVFEEEGKILGTYFIKPNQPALGSHVANAGYMVDPQSHGKGIGKQLCEHSLKAAKELGYSAMQFNIVVSTNTAAVNLWKKYGFEIIGTIPKGFNHSAHGLVDAYIMYKEL